MPENPLQWVSDDDLIDELRERYDTMILLTAKEHPHEEDSTVYNSRSKGPLHTIFGLMDLYKAREMKKYLQFSRDLEDDEDV